MIEQLKYALESQAIIKQLLSERNECVEEIKRLEAILNLISGSNLLNKEVREQCLNIIHLTLSSTTDSIKKLLEEVK